MECKRCGHMWKKRVAGRPVQCPVCHRTDYDKEVVRRYGKKDDIDVSERQPKEIE